MTGKNKYPRNGGGGRGAGGLLKKRSTVKEIISHTD